MTQEFLLGLFSVLLIHGLLLLGVSEVPQLCFRAAFRVFSLSLSKPQRLKDPKVLAVIIQLVPISWGWLRSSCSSVFSVHCSSSPGAGDWGSTEIHFLCSFWPPWEPLLLCPGKDAILFFHLASSLGSTVIIIRFYTLILGSLIRITTEE